MNFTLYQDATTAQHRTETIKSVRVTENHEKPLIKILKI